MHVVPSDLTEANEVETLSGQAAALALEGRLAALDEFCNTFDFSGPGMFVIEQVVRASGRTHAEAGAAIATAKEALQGGGVSDRELAALGAEFTTLMFLDKIEDGYHVVLFYGKVSQQRGYGVVHVNTAPYEMEVVTPKELQIGYKNGAVVRRIFELIRQQQGTEYERAMRTYLS